MIVKLHSWIKRAVLMPVLCWAALGQLVAGAVEKPVAIVSLAGYDAIISDLNFLGELSGTPQLAQSLEGILALVTRAQGLAGLDKAKPIGACVSLPADGPPIPVPLVFIPVTDVDKLLDALQGLVPQVEDLGDGYSRIRTPKGPPVILKRGTGWAFLSDSKEHLEGVPTDPAKLLGDLPKLYDVAVQLNIRNIPDQYLQLALGGLQQGFDKGMQKKPDETEEAYQARKQIGEAYLKQITQLIDEINHITIGFAIDSQTRSTYLDASVTVVEGGRLAAQFATAKKLTKASKYSGFVDEDAVGNFHFHTPIMPDDVKMMISGLDVVRKEADKKIEEDKSLNDPNIKATVKQMVSDVFDVAEATIEGGQFNGGAGMWGEGPFDIALGGLIVDAKKLEKVFKQAVATFGSAPDFPKVELDADKHGDVTFHTLTIPIVGDDDDAKKAKEVFGDEVNLAIGFGKWTVILAVGEDPVELAGEILDDSKEADDELPPAELQVKLGPLMKLGAKTAEEKDKEQVETIAKLLEDAEDDHFNIISEFIPNGSRIRFELEEGVLEAFGKAVVLGMQKGGR
jgi:hypothetical protein